MPSVRPRPRANICLRSRRLLYRGLFFRPPRRRLLRLPRRRAGAAPRVRPQRRFHPPLSPARQAARAWMCVRLFPDGGGAAFRCDRHRACSGGGRARPARGLAGLAGNGGCRESRARWRGGRHRSVRRDRAPAAAARDARAVLSAPQSRRHHRYHDGRFRLAGREARGRAVAAHDPAAAPLVLHAGKHAPIVQGSRPDDGAPGPSVEDRPGLVDRLSVAANAGVARPRRDLRQPNRRADKLVRRHARRSAQAG